MAIFHLNEHGAYKEPHQGNQEEQSSNNASFKGKTKIPSEAVS